MITLLKQAIQDLEKAGCETPQLDAEILLAHALGCERHELYTSDMGSQAPHVTLDRFQSYIERRKKREPVAYITGFKGFWTLNIKVTPAVLIPRPETEEIVEKVLRLFGTSTHQHINTSAQILDLCTGSGCIAAALATELPNARITVSDLSKEALEVAKKNLKFAGDRITFVQSNLFEKISGSFDLIVSNPPYIPAAAIEGLEPEVSHFEPRLALNGGPDGLDFVRKIRQDAPKFLKPGGHLILENGPKVEIWKNSSSKGEFPLEALSA